MRILPALLAIVLASIGLATELRVPVALEGEAGRFVSIPVSGIHSETIAVLAPEGFTLIGDPEVRGGRALVNLYVGTTVLAGEYDVVVHPADEPHRGATIRVSIAARAGIDVRAPTGSTVLLGETVLYDLEVANTGNAPDTFWFELRSRWAGEVERDGLRLGPGESAVVPVRLHAVGLARDLATIRVTSTLDPTVQRLLLLRTEVLPFAGAEAIDGPVQRFRVNLRAAYGSAGVDYAVGALLGGELSDFVHGSAGVDLSGAGIRGDAQLIGEGWRAGYRATSSLQRLEGATGPWQAHLSIVEGGYTVGSSFSTEAWRLSASHAQSGDSRQALGVHYTFRPTEYVSLSPSVTLSRTHRERRSEFGVAIGLGADVQTSWASGSVRLHVPLPAEDAWSVGASLNSRSQSPFGVRAEAVLSPSGVGATVAFVQEVNEELTVRQRLSYGERSAVSLGVQYRPRSVPAIITGNVGGSWHEGAFQQSASSSVSYRFHPWTFGVSASYATTWSASASMRYRSPPWTFDAGVSYVDGLHYLVSAGYSTPQAGVAARYVNRDERHAIGIEISGSYERWEANAAYAYDFAAARHEPGAGVEYTLEDGRSVFANVAVGEVLTWRVGGTFALQGGFATPESVVDLFGGLETGQVEGLVFHDVSRDGVRQDEEPALAGVRVRVGDRESVTDDAGGFRMSLPPGPHTIIVTGQRADLVQRREAQVVVAVGEASSLVVPVETAVSLTGVAFGDHDGSGVFTVDSARLPYARVTLRGGGGRVTVQANHRGEFVFQHLVPGEYALSLDSESLPPRFEATTPPTRLVLEAGPTKRVMIGAAERLREVRRTFVSGDLTVVGHVEPSSAPPGADVRVVAEVSGDPSAVYARIGDEERPLTTTDGRSYAGYVSLPDVGMPVATVQIVAVRDDQEVTQSVLVVVRDGPYAVVRAVPALVDASQNVDVVAEFLIRVDHAYVIIDDVVHDLDLVDPYRFRVSIVAPETPGSYEIALWGSDRLLATSRFLVTDAPSTPETP